MAAKVWYSDGLSFSCTQCGNCCTGPSGYVWFNDAEAKAIANYLQVDRADFLRDYTHKVHTRSSLKEQETEHGHDCVFLTRDEKGKTGCGIYPVRPKQCRTWPFWPENLTTHTAWQRAANTCPGIDHGRLYPIAEIRIIRDGNTATSPTP